MTTRPIMVAVGGDSGTGKTTLVSGLYRIFGADRITNICLDDYHRLDRAARKQAGVTALNPAANNLALMVRRFSPNRNIPGGIFTCRVVSCSVSLEKAALAMLQ